MIFISLKWKKTIKHPESEKKILENKLYGADSVLDKVGAACEKQKEKKVREIWLVKTFTL